MLKLRANPTYGAARLRRKEQGFRYVKRFLDLIIALFAFAALSPALAVLGLLVRAKLGRPILFRQVRPGQGGVPFEMIKFRTMLDGADNKGDPLPDEQRLTAFGSWLRATSLDELPELVNVIRGNMSLVGPRPLLTQYLSVYSPEQARRHEVLPGLTGWAQVNGRNALSWDEKLAFDIWYVDHRSLALDLRILFLTIRKVLMRDGISAPGAATMPPFTGSKR